MAYDRTVTQDEIRAMLDCIDPCTLSYSDWFRVYASAKSGGGDENTIEEWCRKDPRFRSNDVRKRWRGISDTGGATIGTLIWFAKQGGYSGPGLRAGTAPPSTRTAGRRDQKKDPAEDQPRSIAYLPERPGSFYDFQAELLGGLDHAEQRRAFLEALYAPDECVNFAVEAKEDKPGHYVPIRDKSRTYPVSHLMEDGFLLDERTWNAAAGGWIGINPTVAHPQGALREDGTRGNGIADDDIAAFRYTLIESDDIPTGEQIKAFRRLHLPIAALVDSGGKSIHAVVRIDALTREEYDSRVKAVHDWCKRYGVPIDPANKNPSRLMRLPGVKRGEREQRLIGLQQGAESWNDFEFFMEGVRLGLPALDAVEDINGQNLPPRLPEIITGALREKDIMMVSGGSKSRKTFLVIELAIAVSVGMEWLGMQCRQGPVLYVNMEVPKTEIAHRIEKVREAMGVPLERAAGNLFVWNLRGQNVGLEDIKEGIRYQLQRHSFSLIVLDPIYKLLGNLDENAAGDVGQLFSCFDTIAEMTGAAVVFCHHHSKGGQASKVAMDRSSGSGTFARAPDAILDMLELEISPDILATLDFDTKPVGFRYEWTLRGYPPKEAETGFFEYPLHTPDREGILKDARTATEAHALDARKRNANKSLDWVRIVSDCYGDLLEASHEEGNEYPDQVTPDALIGMVQDRTGCTYDTVKKRVYDHCKVDRAKRGKPAFATPKNVVGGAVPEEKEAPPSPAEAPAEDMQQISL